MFSSRLHKYIAILFVGIAILFPKGSQEFYNNYGIVIFTIVVIGFIISTIKRK